MSPIAHLSDLHFGREDAEVVEALAAEVERLAPRLVAVSGDLTQRARRREFEAARRFLDRLPGPRIVVPGNHDIQLFDLWRRVFSPLGRYRRHISSELAPFLQLDELAVLGVNTARPGNWKLGRLSPTQIALIGERFCAAPPDCFKVLVTHHPFLPPPASDSALVGRGLAGLLEAERCGVDLLLAGHLHLGFTGDVRSRHLTIRRSMIVAQAGTAVSRRTRGERNTYNQILLDPPRLEIVLRSWNGRSFETARRARFARRHGVWTAA